MTQLNYDFIEDYKDKTVPWGFNGLGYIVYKRTYARDVEGEQRKEEWYETLRRCFHGTEEIDAGYTQKEIERLYDYIFNLKGTFGGRALWQLGTPLVQKFGGASMINCWVTSIEKVEDFEFLFNMLMLGGGVGFSLERALVHEFPKVKAGVNIVHENTKDADFIVPDSREGWSRLLHAVLKSYFYTGKSFTYSTTLVRGYGEELKTFGGRASGPGALVEGIADICKVLNERTGKKIRSVDALDIANIIGRIVVSGSSRRSAQIAMGDPDDYLFLKAKNWGAGNVPAWRQNSNNSIYADSWDEIIDLVWKGYDGTGEPYGFINRKLAQTQGRTGEKVSDPDILAFNPCAEIGLANKEACNLSTIFLPKIESYKELVDIAKLLYKTQKAITSLPYPYKESETIIRKNRRLGLNITGWFQASEEQLGWLPKAYEELRKFDIEWSKQRGLPASIKLTTVQPGGTLPFLAGCMPGVNPGWSKWHNRRVSFGSYDPLVDYCIERGYKMEYKENQDGTLDHTQKVISFPCMFETGKCMEDVSPIEQLEMVARAQKDWSDNAVSVTVTYKMEELDEIKEWLKENYEKKLKSVSFLRYTGHNFVQPPYQEITEDEYNELKKDLKPLVKLEGKDTIADMILEDCATGACPVR